MNVYSLSFFYIIYLISSFPYIIFYFPFCCALCYKFLLPLPLTLSVCLQQSLPNGRELFYFKWCRRPLRLKNIFSLFPFCWFAGVAAMVYSPLCSSTHLYIFSLRPAVRYGISHEWCRRHFLKPPSAGAC